MSEPRPRPVFPTQIIDGLQWTKYGDGKVFSKWVAYLPMARAEIMQASMLGIKDGELCVLGAEWHCVVRTEAVYLLPEIKGSFPRVWARLHADCCVASVDEFTTTAVALYNALVEKTRAAFPKASLAPPEIDPYEEP